MNQLVPTTRLPIASARTPASVHHAEPHGLPRRGEAVRSPPPALWLLACPPSGMSRPEGLEPPPGGMPQTTAVGREERPGVRVARVHGDGARAYRATRPGGCQGPRDEGNVTPTRDFDRSRKISAQFGGGDGPKQSRVSGAGGFHLCR